tara:strand:- start:37 stop:219 length:183 start_codon:yes stop_codon:yes gene_type:complete
MLGIVITSYINSKSVKKKQIEMRGDAANNRFVIISKKKNLIWSFTIMRNKPVIKILILII